MQKTIRVNDRISVGGQPTESELKELAQAGFRTVVNLRTANEENQPLKPDEEGQMVNESGMDYSHIPVSINAMNETQVDDFRQQVTTLPAPIFVHCASGKRAGAFAMIHAALEQGLSGEQALQTAEQMGFEGKAMGSNLELDSYMEAMGSSHGVKSGIMYYPQSG